MDSALPTSVDSGTSMQASLVPRNGARQRRTLLTGAVVALIAAGVLLRLLIVLLPGNRLNPAWGGVGDAPAYALLAHNIATGKGYAYAGFPTAYRAPVYPLLLAAAMKVFGAHAFEAIRLAQLAAGLAVVYLCGAMAGRLFGRAAKIGAWIVALFFPTLAIMTGDILTEAIASLVSALFLYWLVRFLRQPDWKLLACLAVCVGVGTLAHFNMALLGIVLLFAVLFEQRALPRWRAAAITVCLSGLVIAPWLVRNYRAFHGRLLLSTVSGPTAVMGVLTPQGRALPGDSERLRNALGWVPPADFETNAATRARLGSEAVLSGEAWKVAFKLWKQTGWRLVPLNLKKLCYFWLSTDQLSGTDSFKPKIRLARAAGVVIYWVLLALGVAGWFLLRSASPKAARVFLLYAVLVTVLHLPFNMNTRLRMPFIDPMVAVLAGTAVAALVAKFAWPSAANVQRSEEM